MKITDEDYVDKAEAVIKGMIVKDKYGKIQHPISTSQIRNILAMTSDIYNDVMNEKNEKLSRDICSRIQYLRVQITYAAGRDPKVKNFVDKAEILENLKSINGSRKNFILFSHYMEALVAFQRYYGGKD